MNQRQKGAVAEREVAKLLNSKWLTAEGTTVTARRGQQFSGGPDSPDVVHNIPQVHLEVTRSYKVKPGTEAMAAKLSQAERDCPLVAIPYIVWRHDGDTSWRVTFYAKIGRRYIQPFRDGEDLHEVTVSFASATVLWGLRPTT